MRVQAALVFAVCLGTANTVRADGLVYRLPADGTWSRYSVKQTMALPKGEKMTTEGTLTLASVGQEKVQGEACRWIEIVFEPKQPGKGGATKSVFKALIPEKHLRKGGDPLGHWVKGWAKLGDQEPQRLTKEMLSNPAHMLNLLVSGPLQDTKELEKKVIETRLGKLTCTGLSGSLTLKGAAVRREDGKTTTGDVKVRVRNYFNDKAPFGVASSRMDVEYPDLAAGKNSVEAVLTLDDTLSEVGTGAKSALPDQK